MKPGLDLRLYGVLDPALTSGRDPVDLAKRALDGGLTLLQLRDKRQDSNSRLALAHSIKQALVQSGVPLLINDHLDIAKSVQADGIHVGRTDIAPPKARSILGSDAIIGVTIHHPEDARALPQGVADYAGLGPVYPTKSKDPGDPPLGPFGLERLIDAVHGAHPNMPCVAIAGITHKNAAPVIQAGAHGVAVISDIFLADDVTRAVRRLRDMVDQELEKRGAT